MADDHSFRSAGPPSEYTASTADDVDTYLLETSYQLRTPLSAIVGYAELLMEDPTDADEVRSMARSIRLATNSLIDVIERLERQVMRERARRRMAELLRSLSTLMAASLEFDQVISTIHDCLDEVIEFDRLSLLLRRDDGDYDVAVMRPAADGDEPLVVSTRDDARLAQVEAGRATVAVANSARDPRQTDFASGDCRSWLGVPVVWSDELIGILVLEAEPADQYGEFDVELLASLGAQAGLAIVNARQYSEIQHRADFDVLTGAATRRRFMERAVVAFETAEQQQTPLSLLMLDLDHFKKVNDTYGHPAGDSILQEAVRRWATSLRTGDIIGRYGGEEFAVLLPGLDVTGAESVAERLRCCIGDTPFGGAEPIHVTTSVGVAHLGNGDTLVQLIENADVALYRAKRSGRDRVEVFTSSDG